MNFSFQSQMLICIDLYCSVLIYLLRVTSDQTLL